MRLGAGFTLLEVLVTLIVLAIGMLGLANLQSKIHVTEIESYQRAHAVLLLQDMLDRINSNRSTQALSVYTNATVLGTGFEEDDVDACVLLELAEAGVTANPPPANAERAARDRCEWNAALLGASEQRAGGGGNAGGMIDARGCVEEVAAPDATPGTCSAGIYRVTVAWQGLHSTVAPTAALDCGKDAYDEETKRRVIAAEISIGLPRCAGL